jgi:hypothetical protein
MILNSLKFLTDLLYYFLKLINAICVFKNSDTVYLNIFVENYILDIDFQLFMSIIFSFVYNSAHKLRIERQGKHTLKRVYIDLYQTLTRRHTSQTLTISLQTHVTEHRLRIV